jgi:hypothetical protein
LAVAAMVTPEGAQAIHGLIKIMVYLFTVVGEEHESHVRHAPGTGQPCQSSVPGISSTYAGSRTFLRSDRFLVTHSKGAGQTDTPSIRAYFLSLTVCVCVCEIDSYVDFHIRTSLLRRNSMKQKKLGAPKSITKKF